MRWHRWLIVAGVPALMIAVMAILVWRSPQEVLSEQVGRAAPQVITPAPVLARQLDAAGVSNPRFVDPQDAKLNPQDLVIGLILDGEPRAYLQRAMSGVAKKHVVSDLTSAGRITVTHCDLSSCTRVFVEDADATPKDIRVGGLQSDRSLQLLIDGNRYAQRDTSIPLQEYPFAETSWERWLAEHPQTKVYMGEQSDG